MKDKHTSARPVLSANRRLHSSAPIPWPGGRRLGAGSKAPTFARLSHCRSWSPVPRLRCRETAVPGPRIDLAGWPRGVACRALERRCCGQSDLQVSSICFGTMLFGEQHSYEESAALMSAAAESGCNFFDSAEMYPVPQRAETSGRSEEFLGRWLKHQNRDSVVIATKVAGPSGQMEWIRGGPHSLSAGDIRAAIDGSLRRLNTDYIDLYQIHWPDRYVPMFGDTDYDPSMSYTSVPLETQLAALGEAVDQGKIRYIGLSNETPWGLSRCLGLANSLQGIPRVVSLQNAYSLTCRTFDAGLAEICHIEHVGLLAYSPLAMGLLTGKYLGPEGGPPGARLNRYRGRYAEAESRYGPRRPVVEAVRQYAALANDVGMPPAELALRFVLQHPLVASAVTGATGLKQLAEIFSAAEKPPLSEDILLRIDQIHADIPNPTP